MIYFHDMGKLYIILFMKIIERNIAFKQFNFHYVGLHQSKSDCFLYDKDLRHEKVKRLNSFMTEVPII